MQKQIREALIDELEATLNNEAWFKARAYSILGEQEKNKSILEQYFLPDSEMIHGQMNLVRRTIQSLVLSKNYAEATEMLIKLNRDFPELGDYFFLSEFSFNRAKKEYPPFAEAVANLKMPPPLVEDNQLERLKY